MEISICSTVYVVSDPHTFLQRLQTLEGDLELVRVTELCWVVEDVDAEKRYD